MLIFCRGHYSIDIFGGLLFGHYFWILAERWSWIIDYGLMRIPFHKRFPYFNNKCLACKTPINQWATINQASDKKILKPSSVGSPNFEQKEDEEKRA